MTLSLWVLSYLYSYASLPPLLCNYEIINFSESLQSHSLCCYKAEKKPDTVSVKFEVYFRSQQHSSSVLLNDVSVG